MKFTELVLLMGGRHGYKTEAFDLIAEKPAACSLPEIPVKLDFVTNPMGWVNNRLVYCNVDGEDDRYCYSYEKGAKNWTQIGQIKHKSNLPVTLQWDQTELYILGKHC